MWEEIVKKWNGLNTKQRVVLGIVALVLLVVVLG